eukprot:scaffold804_cov165-Amphora_coffeaeformis.AAC.6
MDDNQMSDCKRQRSQPQHHRVIVATLHEYGSDLDNIADSGPAYNYMTSEKGTVADNIMVYRISWYIFERTLRFYRVKQYWDTTHD